MPNETRVKFGRHQTWYIDESSKCNLQRALQSILPVINYDREHRRSQLRAPFIVKAMRTVFWDTELNEVKMIDQRLLPERLHVVSIQNQLEIARAISNMTIRGAPAIGVAAAFGLALAARESKAGTLADLLVDLKNSGSLLKSARPTAVNLAWAVDGILERVSKFSGSFENINLFILNEAQKLADQDVLINKKMSAFGAELISDGDTIIHHCNTGSLATVDWGTALGVIRFAWEQGKKIHVLVDETRPRLQGARLTAWELGQYGIPYEVITDNMAGFFLRTGKVQKVFFGADRVTANGDVANKIGSYMLALAAKDNGIPTYSVVPTSTIDLEMPSGELIPIEERPQDEVLNIQIAGERVFPENALARNPAFDVTPARLITAIVTENGIAYPPFQTSLARVKAQYFD